VPKVAFFGAIQLGKQDASHKIQASLTTLAFVCSCAITAPKKSELQLFHHMAKKMLQRDHAAATPG
jgi:hypothetical protein